MLNVSVEFDETAGNPGDEFDHEWRLYVLQEQPDDVPVTDMGELGLSQDDPELLPKINNEQLRAKLLDGRAYFLQRRWIGYRRWYRSGDYSWLKDSAVDNPVAAIAGLLVWEHADGPEKVSANGPVQNLAQLRADSADRFLEMYASWLQNDCWHYEISDPDRPETVPYTCRFYGQPADLTTDMASHLLNDDFIIEDEPYDGFEKLLRQTVQRLRVERANKN